MTKPQRQKGYLIICLYTVLMYVGYYAALWFDPSHGMDFGHDLLYLIFVLPVLAIVGGILSYKLTERLVVPAVVQLLTGFVLCPLLLLFVYEKGLDFGKSVTDIFVLVPIATVITVIFACLTKLALLLWRKYRYKDNKQ